MLLFNPTLAIKQAAVGILKPCIMTHRSVLVLASSGLTVDALQGKLQLQTLTGKHLWQC